MPDGAERPSEAKKKPPRRRRGIFEREAIAMMVYLLGWPLLGLLVVLALSVHIRWG